MFVLLYLSTIYPRGDTVNQSLAGRTAMLDFMKEGDDRTPSRPVRLALVVGGSIALVIGIVGIVVPLLPTTPFLIVAAACYGRGSRRCHRWLLTNRVFGRHLDDYLCGRGVSWKVRGVTLFFLWAVIVCTAVLFAQTFWLRALLFVIATGVTIHLVTLGELRKARWVGVLVTAGAYLVALVAAVLVMRAVEGWHCLAALASGTLAATVAVFVVSILTNNSSVYDPYWGLQPAAVVGYYLWLGGDAVTPRQMVVAALVLLYAVRLTSNFYRDWPGLEKEDFRYRELRLRTRRVYWLVSFFGIHLFPTTAVYLGCLPLYAVYKTVGQSFGWLDALGLSITVAAVAVAFVADEQLRRFRRRSGGRGEVMKSGLWAYSRHPNYLGEVAFWWGLWLFALAIGLEWWWTAGGAVLITLMFKFISIPMMEKRLLTTHTGYERYQQVVPVLIPRPWRRTEPWINGAA